MVIAEMAEGGDVIGMRHRVTFRVAEVCTVEVDIGLSDHAINDDPSATTDWGSRHGETTPI